MEGQWSETKMWFYGESEKEKCRKKYRKHTYTHIHRDKEFEWINEKEEKKSQ